MRELTDLSASASSGEVKADNIEYFLGGRQGGTETPWLCNAPIDATMAPLVAKLQSRGYAVEVVPGQPKLTH